MLFITQKKTKNRDHYTKQSSIIKQLKNFASATKIPPHFFKNDFSLNLIGEEVFAAQIIAQSLLKPSQELLKNVCFVKILFLDTIIEELVFLNTAYEYNPENTLSSSDRFSIIL